MLLLRLAVADGMPTNPTNECADNEDEELNPVRVIIRAPPTTETTENGVNEIVTEDCAPALVMLRFTLTLANDGTNANMAICFVESRVELAKSNVAALIDAIDSCGCTGLMTPLTRNERGAREETFVEENMTVSTPPTKLEDADAPAENPTKFVTDKALEDEVKPVTVTTKDWKLETLVGVNDIVRFALADVNTGSTTIEGSPRECNIGPQATETDHKMSTDVENITPSEAAAPYRTRPILKPDTVIVNTLPDATAPPLFPPKALLVVRTRLLLVAKATVVTSDGTLLDPGAVAGGVTSI
jgi:hypothetical protein